MDNLLYIQLVGSLLYITHSRTDLEYSIGFIAIYMQKNHDIHWNSSKRIMHYLQGTRHFRVHYVAGSPLELVVFTDSDWGFEIPLTEIPLQVMYSFLKMVQYSGETRNSIPYPSL